MEIQDIPTQRNSTLELDFKEEEEEELYLNLYLVNGWSLRELEAQVHIQFIQAIKMILHHIKNKALCICQLLTNSI